MNFTITPPSGSTFTIAPLSGTTPAEITIVVDPKGFIVGERPSFRTALRSDDLLWILGATYQIVPPQPVVLADRIVSGPGAPGKLITY